MQRTFATLLLRQLRGVDGLVPGLAAAPPCQLHTSSCAPAEAAPGKGAPASPQPDPSLDTNLKSEGSPNLSSVNAPKGAFNIAKGAPGVTYAMDSYPPKEDERAEAASAPPPPRGASPAGHSDGTPATSAISAPRGTAGSCNAGGSGAKSGGRPAAPGSAGGGGGDGGLTYIDDATAKPHISYATQGSGETGARAHAPARDRDDTVSEGQAPRLGTPSPAVKPAKYVKSEGEKVAPQATNAEGYSGASEKTSINDDGINVTASS